MLIFILGRQPELSRAELAAVFPTLKIVAENSEFLVTEGVTLEEVDLKKIGGVVKVGEVFSAASHFSIAAVIDFLAEWASGRSGKLEFGISVYGAKFNTPKTLLIGAKKGLRERGIATRFANKDFQNLTSAQVELNGLTKKGVEILVLTNGVKWWYAVTSAVQPFDDYKKRDYEKAVRDARIGMLPPKLAQMMINLAVGEFRREARGERREGKNSEKQTAGQLDSRTVSENLKSKILNLKLYDPFCGTGTVLIEAALLGYDVIGSDLNERMVEASQKNLQALNLEGNVFQHDARKPIPYNLNPKPSLVVTEGYLGPPFKQTPELMTREKVFRELTDLYRDFFGWLDASLVVITFPAYLEKTVPKYFSSNSILPALRKIGWEKVNAKPLVYARPDQIVGREIMILSRGSRIIG